MSRPWWPRCRFRFAASREDIVAGRWRVCARPMLHRGRHDGPLAGGTAVIGEEATRGEGG